MCQFGILRLAEGCLGVCLVCAICALGLLLLGCFGLGSFNGFELDFC